MPKEKTKVVVPLTRGPRQPKPKLRREPLPIRIKADHHLSRLLAEGSATDLTIAAIEGQDLPGLPNALNQAGTAVTPRNKAKSIAPGIPDGIPSGIPSGIPVKRANQQKKKNIYQQKHLNSYTNAEASTYVHLDATRTPNEQNLYSNLLRDVRKHGAELEHLYGKSAGMYGYSALLKLTGIRSKTTLRVAIEGLLIKEDIEILSRTKTGTVYRVREPKEILEARTRNKVRVDPVTKWIYSKGGKSVDWAEYLKRITGESRSLSLVMHQEPEEQHVVKPSSSIPDGVSDGVSDGIPESDTQVYQNLIHSLNITNKAETREENISSNRENDDGDSNHEALVKSLYERHTGNPWRSSDNDGYAVVRNLLVEVIEAGIISSILRCPTRVNSFSYCLGAILEFAEFLPPGYLFYLRKKLREKKGAFEAG